MKFKKVVAVAGILTATLLAGCSSGGGKMNIGIIAPTSGGVSVYGIAASNGSKLALDEVNSAGGIGGKEINVILYDDKGDSTESVNAYNKLANNDKAVAVIGAVTSGPTATVANASQADGMPIITPTATEESVTTYGDNIFRACFLDAYQSQTMAGFAISDLSAQTAAILYNSADSYSTGLADAFKSTFESLGGTVVSFEAYISDDKDFKTQLTSIKANSPDVLFLPDYYNVVALIASQVRDVDLSTTLLGADGWDGLFTAIDDKSLVEGAYYCAHYATDDTDNVVQDFIRNFEATYNQTPNSFAALGYDAAKIMAAAIEAAGSTDKAAIVNALKNTSYSGVTGNITFDDNGNPIKSVTVISIQNQEAKLFKKVQP